MSKRRVVITGLGCVTSLAEGADNLFAALIAGKSGIAPIELFDTSLYPVHIGGELKNFEASKYIDAREAKRLDRFAQFSMASSIQAVNDSGLDFSKEDPRRSGVIIGTGIGGIKEIEEQHNRMLEKGPTKVSPFCVPKLMGNAAAGSVSIYYGLRGPNICVVSACASAGHAIAEAFYAIAYGRADMMVSGGSEAACTPIGLASFCALKALSTRNDAPQIASRPFEKDRDGFVLSEGAGGVVLEEYEHAKKRGAKIYAELLGCGSTGDGYHITAPQPEGKGAIEAIRAALDEAGVGIDKVDYINAHGTSTELNDIAESMAIREVFGSHATKVPISSTKSCTGHLLGAAAAVELIACVKAIQTGIIPPTINLDEIDERCGKDMDYVPKVAREKKVNYALSNSFGFGGHNSCLVFGKV
ncbi:MAG: beta-ketoacyl-[acyl-carrier-protein] synthase II [Planctomycetes bacterium GWF2_50_10]|nr:MAG: beta-ketoacyl-[acyl-carrier-protein] synthase II [Planctomycetes bacterium GWF2_50_10]